MGEGTRRAHCTRTRAMVHTSWNVSSSLNVRTCVASARVSAALAGRARSPAGGRAGGTGGESTCTVSDGAILSSPTPRRRGSSLPSAFPTTPPPPSMSRQGAWSSAKAEKSASRPRAESVGDASCAATARASAAATGEVDVAVAVVVGVGFTPEVLVLVLVVVVAKSDQRAPILARPMTVQYNSKKDGRVGGKGEYETIRWSRGGGGESRGGGQEGVRCC